MKRFRSRKYLQRLLLSIVLLVVLTSMISSAILFYYSEQTGLDIQYEANRKVLAQTKYNIDYMSEIVHNLGWSVYNDYELANLFYSDDIAIEDVYQPLRKLQNVVSSTDFLNSIMIYNSYNDSFYSTEYYPMDARIKPLEAKIYSVVSDYFKESAVQPNTEWIPFRSSEDGEIEFFAFFLFEALSGNPTARNKSTLMMNVRTDWFFENLQVINDLAAEESETFVMDENGLILNPPRTDGPDPAEVSATLLEHVAATGNEMDFLTAKVGADEMIFTYLTLDNGWRIVSVQPYDVVFASIRQLRLTYFSIAAGLLLLSIVVSFVVSQRLYRPIQQMVTKIVDAEPGTMKGKDEINSILSVYNRVTDEMRFIRKHYDAAKDIAKNYYLRTIVTNSPSFTEEQFRATVEQNALNVRPDGAKAVALLAIDRYKAFDERTAYADRKLLSFAISNISEEIVSKRFPNEAIDVGEGRLAILISADAGDPGLAEDAAALLNETLEVIGRFYGLSLTAAISPFREGHAEITELYQQVQELMLYRLVFGQGSVITPERVAAREETAPAPELERRWVEAIHLSNVEQFQEYTRKSFEAFKGLPYEQIIHSVLHLVFLLQQAAKSSDKRKAGVSLTFSALNQKVLELETLDEMSAYVQSTFARFVEQQQRVETEEDKSAMLVDTIKEMIESDYKNLNLSLQSVADTLGMSDKYVGRLFKKYETVGVAEYINDVRLRHAVKLLEDERYTVKEIMEAVGFGNESQFFRVFKKKYGVTPGEYRMRRTSAR
ncbi:helix-turn-helix domain-containing protein [Paenibacillus antri]|nr:helix-turn-helix domain-containing protein [Paenibacillus antri]